MNCAFGAFWGAWMLFWLAFARGNKRTAAPVGLRWRFTALAAILVVLLGSRQFPEYFRHALRPPRAACAYIGLALTAGGLGFNDVGTASPRHELERVARPQEGP